MRAAWERLRASAEPRVAAALALPAALVVGPVSPHVLDLAHAAHVAATAAVASAALRPHATRRDHLPAALVALSVARAVLELASVRALAAGASPGRVAAALAPVGPGVEVGGAAVAFVALGLVQLAVVSAGAARAGEVTARFALDALPGRQLAVDADLRAGAIDAEQARARRADVLRDTAAHGAFDAALRVMRAEAAAALALAACNALVAGALAAAREHAPLAETLPRYASLAVGVGVATRAPALVAGAAAAFALARGSAPQREGTALLDGAAWWHASASAAALALAARAPLVAAVACACAAVAAWGRHATEPRVELAWGREGARPDAVEAARRAAAAALDAMGVRGCAVEARAVAGRGVSLAAGGEALAAAEVAPEALEAWAVDAARRGAARLVGTAELRSLVDEAEGREGVAARAAVAAAGGDTVREVMRALVREGVPLRPLDEVFEALAAAGERDAGRALERVRVALRRRVLDAASRGGALEAWVVDPDIAAALAEHAARRPGEAPPRALAEDVVRAVREATGDDEAPVLVVAQGARRALRAALEGEAPGATVIGHDEAEGRVRVKGHVRPT